MRVEKIHITWNAITGAATSVAEADYDPGRIIDLKTDFGTTKCDVDPSNDVRVDVVLGDNTTVSLPIDRAGSALLRRLFDRDCALRAIAAIADIELAPHFRRAQGRERLLGSVEVTRTPESRRGDRRELQIEEISGSILFALTYAGDGKLPVSLRPHDAVVSIPVVLAVANRCDAHALAESRATFVFGVYVRIGSGASQRVILTPSPAVERQASSMITRVCH